MKKLMLLILISVSILVADSDINLEKDLSKVKKHNRANVTYLKINGQAYDVSYQNIGNKTIRWIIKTDTKHLLRLLSHIYYMRNKMKAGYTPHKDDFLFVVEDRLASFIHYRFGFNKDGAFIIDKTADNACAFKIIEAHAKVIQDDFFKGDISKNYSDLAKKIVASPECKEYRHLFK